MNNCEISNLFLAIKKFQLVRNFSATKAYSSSAPSSPSKKQRTSRLELIDIELSKLQRLRGPFVLTREERIDNLRLFYSVRRLAVLKKESCNACLRAAELLGRSDTTVSYIVKKYTDEVSIDSNSPEVLEKGVFVWNRGNKLPKTTKISSSRET